MAKDRIVFANMVIFLAYVLVGSLSLRVGNLNEFVTLMWPPAGIALAGVLLFGPAVLPAIILGAFFVGLPANTPFVAIFGAIIGNTLEPLAIWGILRRFRFVDDLRCSRSVLVLFCVVTAAATIGATCGSLSLWFSSSISNDQLEYTWLKWWFADVLGIIVMTPLILSWISSPPRMPRSYSQFLNVFGFLVTFLFVCAVVLFGWLPSIGRYLSTYAFFPFLIWAAARFDRIGVTIYIFLVSAIGIGSIFARHGADLGPELTGHLIHMQTFVLALSFTGLILAALLSELKIAQATIRHRQESLEEIVEERTKELTRVVDEFKRNQYFLERSQSVAKIGSYRWNIKDNTVKWSPQLMSMFEIDPETFNGKIDTYFSLLPPKERIRIQTLLNECVEQKKGFDFEHVFYTTSGKKRMLRAQGIAVIDEIKGLTEFIGIAQDITEAKQIEEQLQQAKRAAEAANLAKTNFLANMSHEIRTPLGIILGFSELLSDPSLPEHERLGYVQTIQKNGRMLSELINDVLDLSKIETGKVQTELLDVSLDEILQDTKTLMEPKANENGLELRFSFRGKIPERIFTDPTALRQIFVNLVGNAIKFTPNGKIEIRTSMVVQSKKSLLAFDIADTGVGLTSDQRERLFKPFMQADASTTRKFGGSGLGLFLSKSLAQALGGDLRIIASRPGKGTVFRVTIDPGTLAGRTFRKHAELPEVEIPVPKTASVPKELHGKNVLLVEDSVDNQRLVTKFLSTAGAHVDVASNGRLGFEAAMKAHYDIVLMDIQMPLMDGYEATRCLREQGYKAPIVALTAHAMVEERERCLRSGFSDYLSKPISRSELIEHLARL